MNSDLYLQFAMKSVCKYLWRQRTDGRTLSPHLCVYFLKTMGTPWPGLDCVTEVHSADIQMSEIEHKIAAIEVCVCRVSRGLKTGGMNHEEL
jgi:hypothetical protein